VKLFHEKQYEPARDAFREAYELDPRTTTLLDLALAELEADQPVEAIKHLSEYLARPDAPASKLDTVRTKWLPNAEARTARLEVFARGDAEIRVDGVVAEAAPSSTPEGSSPGEPLTSSIVIAAGEHEVSIREGTLVESRRVAVKGGEVVEVHFQRLPDAPVGPALKAWTDLPVREATRRKANPSAKWITFIGLESTAVAAAGVAIGFSLSVERTASTANALVGRVGDSGCLPPTPAASCSAISRDREAEHTDAAVANGLYAGAGVLSALGVASFFLWPTGHETSGRVLYPMPLFGPGTAGGGLTATW
jgi:tetratricopeptide (TPR) repeat protein